MLTTMPQPPALCKLPSQKSSGSQAFKPPSSTERIQHIGLNPIPKIRTPKQLNPKKSVRQVYVKQRKLLNSLQEASHTRAQQQQECQQQQAQLEQALTRFGDQLRASILSGKDVGDWWGPAKAAAAVREQKLAAEEAAARAREEVRAETAQKGTAWWIEPSARRTKDEDEGSSSGGGGSGGTNGGSVRVQKVRDGAGGGQVEVAATAYQGRGGRSSAAGRGGIVGADGDVEAFIDSLFSLPDARHLAGSDNGSSAKAGGAAAAKAGRQEGAGLDGDGKRSSAERERKDESATRMPPASEGSAGNDAKSSGGASSRRRRPRRAVPAWAMSQAEAEAEAERKQEAQEAELVSFAEGLNWERFVADLDDAEVAAAFEVSAVQFVSPFCLECYAVCTAHLP